jgi:hypothetical protein
MALVPDNSEIWKRIQELYIGMDTSTVQDNSLPQEPLPKRQRSSNMNQESPGEYTKPHEQVSVPHTQTHKHVNLQSLDMTDDTMFHTLYYAVKGKFLTTDMVQDEKQKMYQVWTQNHDNQCI